MCVCVSHIAFHSYRGCNKMALMEAFLCCADALWDLASHNNITSTESYILCVAVVKKWKIMQEFSFINTNAIHFSQNIRHIALACGSNSTRIIIFIQRGSTFYTLIWRAIHSAFMIKAHRKCPHFGIVLCGIYDHIIK